MLDQLHDFAVVFISIMLQSLPFVLVGVFASAAVEVFLSERHIGRWLPRRRLPAVLVGSLLGLVVPVCDCGAIPLGRRLVAKGAPVYAGVTFMLAAPVINPIVALSTAVAFQFDWRVVGLRLSMTFITAVTIGLLASFIFPERDRRPGLLPSIRGGSGPATAPPVAVAAPARRDKLRALLAHANDEFFDIIFYILLGALFTAASQTFIPRTLLMALGSGPVLSVAALMPLATILSICSEADAFVARAFATTFTLGSVLAFMVIGQIVDLRNGVLLFRTLGTRYTALIVGVGYVLVFLLAVGINLALPVR